MPVLGAVCPLLSTIGKKCLRLPKNLVKLTFEYPHEGPCVVTSATELTNTMALQLRVAGICAKKKQNNHFRQHATHPKSTNLYRTHHISRLCTEHTISQLRNCELKGGTFMTTNTAAMYAPSSMLCLRKVDVRLPGKGNSNIHGAMPVHLNHLND